MFSCRRTNITLFRKYRASEKRLCSILDNLQRETGLGIAFGSMDILSLTSTIPPLKSTAQRRKKNGFFDKEYRIDDRMTVQEMSDMIESQNQLTFDYLILLTVGAVIAAAGLLQDSPVTVVASMLVSPLMGPILSVAFGFRTRMTSMCQKGIRNELIGVLICIVVGFIAGLSCGPFLSYDDVDDVPLEIRSRGTKWTLIAGVFVAIASGVGVAIGVMQGGVSTLVGIAISAALLPPVVNCGLCFALHFNVNGDAEKFEPNYFLHISLYSGGLFILNIICIVICANLTFVLKKVNVAKSIVITKTQQRRRSESSAYLSDVSSNYMNPPTTSQPSSKIMDSLLCRQQNDRDLIRPLVMHSHEMKSSSCNSPVVSSSTSNNLVVDDNES